MAILIRKKSRENYFISRGIAPSAEANLKKQNILVLGPFFQVTLWPPTFLSITQDAAAP